MPVNAGITSMNHMVLVMYHVCPSASCPHHLELSLGIIQLNHRVKHAKHSVF